MRWRHASWPMGCRRTRVRGAPVMDTTNAWCAIRKAIVWKSLPKLEGPSNEITGVVPVRLSVGAAGRCAAGTGTAPSVWPAITQTAKPWTRWWWPGSAVDRTNITRAARSHRRRRHRRRRDHAHLRRARRRGALPRFPVTALGGDARVHGERSAAPGAGRGHGHRHRLALRRPDGECRPTARARLHCSMESSPASPPP